MNTDDTLALNKKPVAFAVAAGEPSSTTIHTDDSGLVAGDITLPSQSDEMPAYMAKPAGEQASLPIVIVVQEIFGVHEHIRDLCRRLAKQGYLAVAPALYFRQGNPASYEDISTLFAQLVSKVPDSQVLADLDHTAHWAAGRGGDSRRLAVVGFCWGGRIAWLYAAHNPQLKAAVAWYGKLVGEKSLTTPRHPVDVADELVAPVLGLYGGQDTGILPGHVDAMRKALQAAKADADIVVYPDAGHAFNADYRPNYHADSAKDGWGKMLRFLARHGVAGGA
ncbi:dienelactone hydrolase family protein [Martelella alba]|uniref:Dienelactone hydrolase family protein n=1 Tax=Martelella alba TaxID=2590451 RepID=A0ABY2SMU7_9HYPH|nr:dienelactone hydrolase family protein [Martelella alba]TKI07137.1 dienelactone hydrolase family protein [Martelella alba]